MNYVEELFTRLLVHWNVDISLRLPPEDASGAFRAERSATIGDADPDRLARTQAVQRIARSAVDSGGIVVLNDAEREFDEDLGIRSCAALPVARSDGRHDVVLFASRRLTELPTTTVKFLDDLGHLIQLYQSERDQNGHQLRQLVIQLTEAEDRERGRIAALLHDDLQQMLAGIKVHLDMAARRASGDEYVTQRIATAISLLENAIEQSRNLSHELNPPLLRRGLVPALRTLASEVEQTHRLRVSIDAPDETVPLSEFVRLIVFRSVQELLFNIVKHAGVNEASFELENVGGGLRLAVKDHGAGFDVDAVLREDAPTGLGLISIRERLEAIGAMLEVQSLPGAGSTFTIYLPPEATKVSGVLAREHDLRDRAPGRKTTVMLADDHAVIRQGLAMLLNEEPDIEVIAAADSGDAAIDLARQLRPDVVVMDLTMPGLSGDEATRRILRESPLTRVIGLSMHSEQEAKERMLAAGAIAYLPKAGPSDDLVRAIRGDDRTRA